MLIHFFWLVSQSVKEVLQSLVDDCLVNTDKCGVQTVFWAFPSEASQKKKAKLAVLEEQLGVARATDARLAEEVEDLRVGREDVDEEVRQDVLKEMEETEEEVRRVEADLSKFAEFDPDEMNKLRGLAQDSKIAANRWIDNIFSLQSWASRTFMMDKKVFSAQFDIPEELDYIEE